jgi:hemolysin III
MPATGNTAMSLVDLLNPDDGELAEHYPNRFEHAADLIVHLVGLAAAVIGGGILFYWAMARGGSSVALATALYALCIMVMLACSAAYNLTRPSRARRVLRRLDEAAIFLMIAGSYTPFLVHIYDPPFSTLNIALVWTLAVAGACGKLFMPQLSDRFWCVVYIAFGWLSVALVGPFATHMPMSVIVLLAAGGLVYTVGVLFYLNHGLPFRRAIWHSFVVVGAGLHFAAVATGVVFG